MKLRVGVIGLYGHRDYADKFLSHPDVVPVGIADHGIRAFSTETECRDLARHYDLSLSPSWQEMWSRTAMDACLVMCPWKDAPKIVCRLAEKGIHILSEKPIAGDPDGARKIAEAVRKYRVTYSACFSLCKSSQPFKDARWWLDTGMLGTPLTAHFTYLATHGPLYTTKTPHYRNPSLPADALSGGEIAMFSGYGIICLQWFTGKRITQVFTRAGTFFYDHYREMRCEDLATVHLRLGDIVGSMTLGRTPVSSEPARIEVDLTGTDGSLRIDGQSNTITVLNGQDTIGKGNTRIDYTADPAATARFIDDFVTAVRNGRPPAITAGECFDTISVLDAIYRSAHSGHPEKIIDITGYESPA